MAIRSWGESWRIQVLFSLLVEVVYEESHDGFFGAQLERYSVFLDYMYQHKLQDVQKLILNGWVAFCSSNSSFAAFLES